MAKRWAPILGVTGFDGGSKPAISLATRTGRLIGGEGAGEGGGGPSPGPGACCHTDGSCDELFQFDCLASGGQWQGPGTTCDDVVCTGACCAGTCTQTTEAECSGTFLGVGVPCDPDQTLGACCTSLLEICSQFGEEICGVLGDFCEGGFRTSQQCCIADPPHTSVRWLGSDTECDECEPSNFVCCQPSDNCCLNEDTGNYFCCPSDQPCCPTFCSDPVTGCD